MVRSRNSNHLVHRRVSSIFRTKYVHDHQLEYNACHLLRFVTEISDRGPLLNSFHAETLD